jgi:hypothetical protein
MPEPSRRGLLRDAAASLATATAAGVLAGCVSDGPGNGTRTTTSSTTKPTDDDPDGSDLTDWDESPDCITSGERDDQDAMYDSVISVQSVNERIADTYAPIQYADLTAPEREVIDAVTTDGGYATCETGEGFDRFLDRVREHGEKQDLRTIFLERDDTYYGLYVEDLDQVYSY